MEEIKKKIIIYSASNTHGIVSDTNYLNTNDNQISINEQLIRLRP